VVVDCLTMWLTNWMMPMEAAAPRPQSHRRTGAQRSRFLQVLAHCPGPVVLVGNEIGLGVIPMGREVRAFVDALGC
jgi:adenosylcobinamide kinase/adenosylcobinamide-phosphate guanylyltransferase